ncbi:MAG: hypothetical protein ACKVW3_01865 [Phycisphaerales bacterium]
MFAAAGTKIYEITELSAPVEQVLPVSPNSNRWSHANINGQLVCQQEGGAAPPIFFNGTAWLSCLMPQPTPAFTVANVDGTGTALTSAGLFGAVVTGMACYGHANVPANATVTKINNNSLTLSVALSAPISAQTLTFSQRPTFAADGAGGSVDAGDHFYRVRWLFRNGTSIASIASAVKTVAGPNNTVNLIVPRRADRSDYLGFQIERTKVGFPNVWFFVGTVLSTSTSTYADPASDASLGTRIDSEPGPYGQMPTLSAKYFDGIAAYREILFGWIGTNLYWSRDVGDAAAPGAGCFNFHPNDVQPVRSDDGDSIIQCLEHGDSLAIGKGQSVNHLVGYDRNSFQLLPTYKGVGFASTRGAAAHGSALYWYGGRGRIYRMAGGQVMQIGKRQVGHYLSEMDFARDGQTVMRNYLGERLLFAYGIPSDDVNEHVIAMRLDDGRWEHYADMRIADMLVQNRRDDFAGATAIFADTKLVDTQEQSVFATYPSYVAWLDDNLGPDQVRVQKFNSSGVEQWTAGGVLVSSSPNASSITPHPFIIPLSATLTALVYSIQQGGVDRVPFVQFFNASGAPLLSGQGVQIPLVSPGGLSKVVACRASATSVWVGWNSVNSYIERITSSGVREMTPTDAQGRNISPSIIGGFEHIFDDGSGGFYLVAQFSGADRRLYRFDSTGTVLSGWPELVLDQSGGPDGARRCTRIATSGDALSIHNTSGLSIQLKRTTPAGVSTIPGPNVLAGWSATWSEPSFSLVADNENGAYFAFQDQSNTSKRTYVMRFRADGTAAWGAPVVVHTATQNPNAFSPVTTLLPDGAGGAIVIFAGGIENGTARTVLYAQRISIEGVPVWPAVVQVCDLTNPTTATQQDYYKNGWAVPDGSGGCLVALPEQTPGTIYKLQRINGSGNRLFGATGKVVATMTSGLVDDAVVVALQEAFDAGLPTGAKAGYHLWSAFDGFRDEAARTGVGGRPRQWYMETPAYDDGTPDVVKQFDELRVLVTKGNVTFSANISTADGTSSGVQLAAAVGDSTWGNVNTPDIASTLYWGPATGANPAKQHNWGGAKESDVTTGLPEGTIGKRYALTLSAEVDDELVVAGHAVDYRHHADRGIG